MVDRRRWAPSYWVMEMCRRRVRPQNFPKISRSGASPLRFPLRHRATPPQTDQGQRLPQGLPGDGLQAHRVRPEALASPQRPRPDPRRHRRCHLHRRSSITRRLIQPHPQLLTIPRPNALRLGLISRDARLADVARRSATQPGEVARGTVTCDTPCDPGPISVSLRLPIVEYIEIGSVTPNTHNYENAANQ